jgi:agmatinase
MVLAATVIFMAAMADGAANDPGSACDKSSLCRFFYAIYQQYVNFANFDGIPLLFGHYLTRGAPVRRVIDEEHVMGRNFIQIGLNSAKPGLKDIEWMRKNQVSYHVLAQIDRDGWPAVMKQALADAMDGPKKIFISVDTDVLDPAWAPGMGPPQPGGIWPRELFPIRRDQAVQNEVADVELFETR